MRKMYFVNCEKCGKRLIARLSNGLWYFVFGRKKTEDGQLLKFCPVEIYIHGSLKMKCLDRECDHWNILHYFPSTNQMIRDGDLQSELKQSNSENLRKPNHKKFIKGGEV